MGEPELIARATLSTNVPEEFSKIVQKSMDHTISEYKKKGISGCFTELKYLENENIIVAVVNFVNSETGQKQKMALSHIK